MNLDRSRPRVDVKGWDSNKQQPDVSVNLFRRHVAAAAEGGRAQS